MNSKTLENFSKFWEEKWARLISFLDIQQFVITVSGPGCVFVTKQGVIPRPSGSAARPLFLPSGRALFSRADARASYLITSGQQQMASDARRARLLIISRGERVMNVASLACFLSHCFSYSGGPPRDSPGPFRFPSGDWHLVQEAHFEVRRIERSPSRGVSRSRRTRWA